MKAKNEDQDLKNRIQELQQEIQKMAEDKNQLKEILNKKEVMLNNVLNHSTNVFYSHTANHEITYFSPQVYDVLGYKPEEAMMKWTELASDHPMNGEGYLKTIKAIETGKVQEPYELELIHKKGNKVYVRIHEAPVVENGKTTEMVGSLTDITDEKLSGTGLKESEEKFQLLFEKSQNPILLIEDYYFIDCNKAAVDLLKYDSKEEIFKIHPSKLSPEYQPDGKLSYKKAQEMMDIAYKNGYHRFDWIHLDKNGKELIMDVALTRIPYNGKEMIFTIWRDISKQKEFEKSLIESEKKFSTLFEQAADGILVGIKGGEIIEANQSICNLSGYKKEELIGKNINMLFKPEVLSSTPLRYDLVKKGDTVLRERELIKKNGKVVFVEMKTKILEDGRMQALFRDITKRKEAEEKLIISRNQLQKAERIAGLGNYFYNVKTDNWKSSDILNTIYGIDESYEKSFKSWLDIIHRDYREEMMDYFSINILQNHEPFNKQYKIERISDGEERWVHGYGEIEYDSDNNPIHIFGAIQDITERKLAETALMESEEKYRNIFHGSPMGIFHYNMTGELTDCNESFAEIIGSSAKALIGFNMLRDLKNNKLINCVKESIKSGKAYFEDWYQSVTTDKETFVRVLFNGIKDENNQIISGIGLVEDITKRKLAEIALTESEEKILNIYHNSKDIIMIIDKEVKIININKALEDELGYEINEIIGKSPRKIIQKRYWDTVESRIKKMLQGKKMPAQEFIMRSKNGLEIPFEGNSKLINYEGNKAILSVIRNIKERKQFEQRIFDVMIETEEKERQRLASDIHDEVGPLLSSLKMYIEMLNQNADKQDFIKNKLQELVKETITNVREVSNALSPNVLIEYGLVSAINSYINTQKEIIKIQFESILKDIRFGIKIETVYYRILKELVNNTLKHARAKKITVQLLYENKSLILRYKDDGIGLNTKKLKELKPEGLGLNNIKNRIKTIHGTYMINSNKDEGFQFELITQVNIN